jgi:hypothetical protein
MSGTALCNELITRPEESYRLWCVVLYDHETSCEEEAIASGELQSQEKNYILCRLIDMFLVNPGIFIELLISRFV